MMETTSDHHILKHQINQLQIGEAIDLSSIGFPVYIERSGEDSYNAAPSDHSAPEEAFHGIDSLIQFITQSSLREY